MLWDVINCNDVSFVASELHLASYESEGPENNMEKDSRRSLRWVNTGKLRTVKHLKL